MSSNTKFLLCIVIFLVLCIFGVAAKNFVIFGITNNNHLIDKISDKDVNLFASNIIDSTHHLAHSIVAEN